MSKEMPPTSLPIVPQLSDDLLSRYALEMLRRRPAVSPLDDVLREQKTAARENIPIIGPLEGAMSRHWFACGSRPRATYWTSEQRPGTLRSGWPAHSHQKAR